MGLLDEFDTMPDDRKSAVRQGLLTMGLNMLAGGGTFAQQLGRGGLAGLGGYQDALDKQKAEQSQKTLRQMQELQLQQAQRGAARQQRIDALPGQFYQSPAQQALAGGGGPTVGNAQRMEGMTPQFDAEGYGRALMGVDPQAGVAFQQSIAKQQPAPVAVGEGQTLVDPRTGRPIFSAGQKPMAVSEGQTLLDPATGRPLYSAPKTVSPDAQLSAETTRRGQDFNMLQGAGEVTYQTDPATGQLVALPKQMGPGGQITPRPVSAGTGGSKDAKEALALADQAEAILKTGGATGSGAGSLIDSGAAFFGKSTQGAQASAQLQAIGGMLTAKMPKMSGPQSDSDVKLYREMAGAVGDASKPIQTRLAALQTVREIQQRYAGQQDAPSTRVPTPMPGMVRNGYRLKPGGSPADPNSWEPVR
jgi:hypothetical protein